MRISVGSRILSTALAATLAFSIIGIGTPVTAATKVVKMRGTQNKFRPVHSYIGRGDKIVWRNRSSRVHDVTAYGKGWTFSKVLSPGERAARKFRKRGTYRYRCVRHSGIVDGRCQGMCGFVHVVA